MQQYGSLIQIFSLASASMESFMAGLTSEDRSNEGLQYLTFFNVLCQQGSSIIHSQNHICPNPPFATDIVALRAGIQTIPQCLYDPKKIVAPEVPMDL